MKIRSMQQFCFAGVDAEDSRLQGRLYLQERIAGKARPQSGVRYDECSRCFDCQLWSSRSHFDGKDGCICTRDQRGYRAINPECTVKGHLSSVLSVAFSPDGKKVVSGGADKRAKIWDVETGAEVSIFAVVS